MEPVEQLAQFISDAIVKPDLTEYLNDEERGDAELFESLFAGKVVFDHSEKRWYLWNCGRWQPDLTRAVYEYVQRDVAAEYLGAAEPALRSGNTDHSNEFIKRPRRLRFRHRMLNVLELASSLPGLALRGTEWDIQPMLLPVSNGILDLTNGSLREIIPSDYIRIYAPTHWQGLDCPAHQWERALLDIFCDDVELIGFFRRLCGYAISGDTSEQVLPILWGQGANGKSTVMDMLSVVIGQDLCFTTQSDSLMDLGRGDANAARPFISALRNKRLVLASESDEGRRLNAGLVKQLTGDRYITARNLYSGPITFKQMHTIMLITNHCPRLPDSDDFAMWRRVLRIPFNMRFVDNPKLSNERKRDKQLGAKLKAEAPGILAWTVRGCLEWQQDGLNPPASVQASTTRYREEEDLIGQFINERLVEQAGMEAASGELYKEYTSWCAEFGYKPLSSQAFGQRITARFGTAEVVWKDRRSRRVYRGIGLLSAEKGPR